MVPVGTHRARPIDCVLGMTGTGKEQVGVLFELVDNPAERITWYGYFTDGTFERTIESLRYLGWQGNDLLEFHRGLPAGVGNEVEIVVEDEADQNGEPRRRVKWINSGRGVAVKEILDDDKARAFSARMKARVAALQAKSGAAKPASRPAAPAPVAVGTNASGESIADDDIPF
jgi:hypothetical protein